MKTASVEDVKARFIDFVQASAAGPVVVTHNGKPVAALIGVDGADDVERLALAYSPEFRAIAQAAHRRIDEGKGIPHEEFWRGIEAAAIPPKKAQKPRAAPSPKRRRTS
jgi:prevent-host-death family protein